MIFDDRADAGKQLASRLTQYKDQPNVIVLAIPRGGVIVAAEIARALDAPLDVFLAHKLGAPFNSELAIGALTSTGQIWLDEALVAELHLSKAEIEREQERQRREIARRLAVYRSGRPPLDLRNKIVIVVDDGVATGATTVSALLALRQEAPGNLILAIPVGPPETVQRLADMCDQVVVLETPDPFMAVGHFYREFGQTSDEEVIKLLAEDVDPMSGLV
jgi:putative phosphoribosyl transferase